MFNLNIVSSKYLIETYWIKVKLNIKFYHFQLDEEIDFPPVNPNNKLHIDIRWTREGSSDIGDIRLLSYNLNGTLLNGVSDRCNYWLQHMKINSI